MSEETMLSMEAFDDEINRSFKKLKEGDIIKGTVIGVSDTKVNVDLGYYAEGIIQLEELSNDPKFSIKQDILVGDSIKAMVLAEDDGEGNISLSLKQATDVLAWEKLKEAYEEHRVFTVKIAEAVKAGVVTYLEGIRAFIPASQLALSYVEDLTEWVGKTLEVEIITVEESNYKLVLSGKEVAKKKEEQEKISKLSKLQKGIVTTGVIEKITPYGCFVNIGDHLSGLVHISQICGRHIKHPGEIVKEGEEVKVKILDIKDGKISLSIKAVEDREAVVDDAQRAPVEYSAGEEATTGLGSLLKGFKFDN
ncbi:MAG: S1 RNA-binding domain-containing protein [Velocimicrobium sp.]